MEEKGIVEGFEAEVIRKDGTKFWISINGRAVRDGNGRIIYYEGTNIDITQRKKAEEALREQEKLLRLITENMYDLVSQTDTEGRFVYVSPSNRIVLGYEPEEMLGHHILERVHPDDAQMVASAVEQALTEKTGGRIEYRYQHRDGHYLWLETIGSLIFDAEGRVTGAVFTARDITDRKKAEMALRDSEELYRAIVENTHDAIYIYRDSLLIYVNRRLCEILGYAAQELLGTNMLHLIHPEDRAMIAEYTERRARDDNPPECYEGRVITKDGRIRIIEFRPSKINYQGGYAVLGAARDITEQEEAEKALRESEEKYRKIFNKIGRASCRERVY
jgi:PAS domain S-box-containing protein